MDQLGETIENVGLAQEIQKGLAGSLQKPPKWQEIEAETEAYKSKFGGMAGWAVYNTSGCTKYCIVQWAKAKGFDLSQGRRRSSAGGAGATYNPPSEAGVNANWDEFKASEAFSVMCKYSAYADKLAGEKVNAKQFEEVRPLGACACPRRS